MIGLIARRYPIRCTEQPWHVIPARSGSARASHDSSGLLARLQESPADWRNPVAGRSRPESRCIPLVCPPRSPATAGRARAGRRGREAPSKHTPTPSAPPGGRCIEARGLLDNGLGILQTKIRWHCDPGGKAASRADRFPWASSGSRSVPNRHGMEPIVYRAAEQKVDASGLDCLEHVAIRSNPQQRTRQGSATANANCPATRMERRSATRQCPDPHCMRLSRQACLEARARAALGSGPCLRGTGRSAGRESGSRRRLVRTRRKVEYHRQSRWLGTVSASKTR